MTEFSKVFKKSTEADTEMYDMYKNDRRNSGGTLRQKETKSKKQAKKREKEKKERKREK